MNNRTLRFVFGSMELNSFLHTHKAYDITIEDIIGESAMEIFELIKVWDNQWYENISIPECEELFIKHGFYLVK